MVPPKNLREKIRVSRQDLTEDGGGLLRGLFLSKFNLHTVIEWANLCEIVCNFSFIGKDLEDWWIYLHFQQEAGGMLCCIDHSSSVPPSIWCQVCTGCDAARCSLCTGLEASDILPCISKGCVGEGATHERLCSVGEPEDGDCIPVAADLFMWLASDCTNTGISDCIVCTAIDSPTLP